MGKDINAKVVEEIKDYRKEKSLKLIDEYKDLIGKTFVVVKKDLLQNKIESEDEKESEQQYLDAIKKRRVALDEVDLMLDKIEKLENNFNEEEGSEDKNGSAQTNWAKRKAQENK